MEKYGLEWWQTFHETIKLLARLEAFDTFDMLTCEVLADCDDSIPLLHTAIQWYTHAS